MAEVVAAVGLASALISFVDFGTKVIRQLRQLEAEVADQPRVFQGVRIRLPLMLELVKKITLQMDAGMIDKATQEHMATLLGGEVERPFSGVLSEADIEKIDNDLKRDFDLLLQAGTFQSLTRVDEAGRQACYSPSYTQNPSFRTYSKNEDLDGRRPSNNGSLPVYDDLTRIESRRGNSIFTVPFPRDSNFLGRQSSIDEIDKRFESQRYVALAGLGGIGKSQIAIEYAYLFREQNTAVHVFWVYASNPTRFEQGFQTIARKLAIPGWDDEKVNTLELVREFLSDERNGQYLMILDNADDASLFFQLKPDGREVSNDRHGDPISNTALVRHLPNSTQGSILITTRDRRVGERLSSRKRCIDVDFMSPSESIELLRPKIMEEDWDESDGFRLVKELSYLPLAITQAAGFISENCMTVSEYLDALHSGKDEIKELLSEHLEDTRREIDTENSVMRTWKLSFDKISETMPRAAEMLSILVVLDLQGATATFLHRDGETLTAFRTALGALQAFSLVTASRGRDSVVKMHRLVALSTQRWLELCGTIQHWQSEALRLVEHKFPASAWAKPEEWATVETLMPHAQTVFSFTLTSKEDLLRVASLLGAVALYNLIRGRYEEACKQSQRSLDIRQALLSPSDPLNFESANMLGESLLHRGQKGDVQAAEETLTTAMKGREQVLGSVHEDTLESKSDLATTLLAPDKVDKALETAHEALKGRREVLGEGHQDTLVSLNIYALAHQRKGSLQEARVLTEEALKGREQLLGPEHPDTLITLNNLARLQIQQGEYTAAKTMLERTLAGEVKVLGAEGYDAQVTMSNTALLLQLQGDFEAAETIFRKVLAMRTKSSGPEHPSTILVLRRLVELFDQKGDKPSLEAMKGRLKEIRVREEEPAQPGALLQAGLLFD